MSFLLGLPGCSGAYFGLLLAFRVYGGQALNSGLRIRAPLQGDPYSMEIRVP